MRFNHSAVWFGAVGVVGAVVGFVYFELDGTFWPVTNPHRYAHLADRYRYVPADAGGSVMAVFPVGIPATATHVRFHYQTPPGDVALQLRCTLQPADVAALVARVAPAALTMARGREQASGYYHGPEDEHDFYVGNGPNWYLPESYTVYTTAVGHADEHGGRWNYEAGVAVEPRQGDVIYWMQAVAGLTPTAATR